MRELRDNIKVHGALALCAWLVGAATGCSGVSASADACAHCVPDAGLVDAGYSDALRAEAGPADGGPVADFPPPPPVPGPVTNGVVTLAGWFLSGYQDGLRYAARFANPANVLVGPSGDVYVADYGNGVIRVITPLGATTTLTAPSATFRQPFGMVFAPNGTFYVQTDYEATGSVQSGALWRIDLSTGKPTLVLDRSGRARGLVALADGRIALLQYWDHTVELFDPVSRTRTPLAGKFGAPGHVNGQGAVARFNMPYDGVVVGGDLVITDTNNHRLRRVTLAGVVSNFAGNGSGQSASGTLVTSSFNKPQGLAQDSAGNLYVTDVGGHVVRKIAAGQVTTIAGHNGSPGADDSVDPHQAKFFGLEGIDVIGSGKIIYVADGDGGNSLPYNRVRRIAYP